MLKLIFKSAIFKNFLLSIYIDESRTGGVAPGGIVVGSVDELPPPYTSVTGGAPMVTCRVCQVIYP